ncbi:MAG: hypothetical protein A3C06_01875 [Candidatus Taylorbacteria bacterium RIFCSPHIGHO2_02_FULL_46_13]|uniref:Uncharacterized protein n=1 Tax=Candidatus Taylorbacteria bacterium RIFCSPHIGHO2_02_FULL_46_13 TaxID=1802312 RepID=A0A1G2MSH7_9BACT|nr:MAG: hypothetical protein A3C06_01875 [Candidatus Taylorbacteria bacterium RIFCSPHIGHO2_02_FULL_46_13]
MTETQQFPLTSGPQSVEGLKHRNIAKFKSGETEIHFVYTAYEVLENGDLELFGRTKVPRAGGSYGHIIFSPKTQSGWIEYE